MIRFQAFGVAFRLPLLTLLMPVLAARLGLQGEIGAVMLALGLHEMAHILAAHATGVRITEIQLLPFGGSARMENPYQLPPGRIIVVAAAGPAANLLTALIWGLLAHRGLATAAYASTFIQPNLILFLFNLLPALPLDGGRILFALLQRPLDEGRALNIGLWLGRLLAASLLCAVLAGGIRSGSWNLTLILAAVFLLASARDERSALRQTRASRMEEQLHSPSSPRPTRIYQLDDGTTVQQALALLRPREGAWFVLLRDGNPYRLLDGRSVVEHLLNGSAPDAALRNLPAGFSLETAPGAPKAAIFH